MKIRELPKGEKYLSCILNISNRLVGSCLAQLESGRYGKDREDYMDFAGKRHLCGRRTGVAVGKPCKTRGVDALRLHKMR